MNFMESVIRRAYIIAGVSPERIAEEYELPLSRVMSILGIYDLSKEPPAPSGKFPEWMMKDWEKECRRLNPKAWATKKAL